MEALLDPESLIDEQMSGCFQLLNVVSMGQNEMRLSPYIPPLVRLIKDSPNVELNLLALRCVNAIIDGDPRFIAKLITEHDLHTVLCGKLLTMVDLVSVYVSMYLL